MGKPGNPNKYMQAVVSRKTFPKNFRRNVKGP